jgi:hypothetical protein
MILDALILISVAGAIAVGFRRGTIQPLLTEIGLLVVLVVLGPRLSGAGLVGLAVMLAIGLAVGYGGWRAGGIIHRMPAVQGVDGLLGVFVQGLVAVFVCYFFISGLIGLGKAFGSGHGASAMSPSQVAALRRELGGHPLLAHLIAQRDLDTAAKMAAQPGGVRMAEVPGLVSIRNAYQSAGEPQLRSSRLAPIVLSVGHHVPGLGHFGPKDLPRR